MSYPYHGEDFCMIHGNEYMRSAMGNPIPWCEQCEEDRMSFYCPRHQHVTPKPCNDGDCECKRKQ